ncbi:MAG: ABC transporter permease [Bacillota bacterium]|nr:ABC transporter permease [Bacillota bacterium]
MKLLHITYYKLKTMLADKVFFAAMIIIPLFITIATGYALRHEKLNVVPIAVVDEDKSSMSETLLNRLHGKGGLQIKLTDSEKAYDMLDSQKVEAVFVIKQGFESSVDEGSTEGIIDLEKSPSSFATSYVQELVAGEVMRLSAEEMAVDKVVQEYNKAGKKIEAGLEPSVRQYYDSQWEPKPIMTLDYREIKGKVDTAVNRVSLPASTATSTGILLVFIMFFILFSSGWVIEEKINGTLKRLVAGPGALIYSFSGNIAALMCAGIIQIALITLVNNLAFGVNLFSNPLIYVLFTVYLLSVISISMFMSSVLKTPAQLQAGAPVFAFLTGFAGGCFWNFVDPSKQIKQLAAATPQGWTLKGINSLLVNPGNTSTALAAILVLLAVSAVLLPVSYLLLKRQVAN